ncbi:MAG: hypothetical protein K8R88_11145, partial [Armatimonadetes bacterium]|nr:hypothetical protein [Armatimonadota bacterium]
MKSPLIIGSLTVQLQNVTLPFGLTVDQIDVSGKNLSINTSSGKIEGVEGDTAVAIVGEQNLLEFLQKELPEQLKELEVFIGDGFIKLNAKATIIFQVNVSAITKLVLANGGSEVLIELTDVSP